MLTRACSCRVILLMFALGCVTLVKEKKSCAVDSVKLNGIFDLTTITSIWFHARRSHVLGRSNTQTIIKHSSTIHLSDTAVIWSLLVRQHLWFFVRPHNHSRRCNKYLRLIDHFELVLCLAAQHDIVCALSMKSDGCKACVYLSINVCCSKWEIWCLFTMNKYANSSTSSSANWWKHCVHEPLHKNKFSVYSMELFMSAFALKTFFEQQRGEKKTKLDMWVCFTVIDEKTTQLNIWTPTNDKCCDKRSKAKNQAAHEQRKEKMHGRFVR